jgi:hypothetical protein
MGGCISCKSGMSFSLLAVVSSSDAPRQSCGAHSVSDDWQIRSAYVYVWEGHQ